MFNKHHAGYAVLTQTSARVLKRVTEQIRDPRTWTDSWFLQAVSEGPLGRPRRLSKQGPLHRGGLTDDEGMRDEAPAFSSCSPRPGG